MKNFHIFKSMELFRMKFSGQRIIRSRGERTKFLRNLFCKYFGHKWCSTCAADLGYPTIKLVYFTVCRRCGLILLLTFFWVSHNFKYLFEAIKFVNLLPVESRESAHVVHLDEVDQVLDGQNFGRYAVVFKQFQEE